MRQITSINACGTVPRPDGNRDIDRCCLHMRGNRGFIIIGNTHTISGNRKAANIYANGVLINIETRFADGHDDAAPICIFAGDGCFHQR